MVLGDYLIMRANTLKTELKERCRWVGLVEKQIFIVYPDNKYPDSAPSNSLFTLL